MGAWGENLLSNDYVLDALFDFENVSDEKACEIMNTYYNSALKESKTFQLNLTEDDLPLIYEESEKEALLNPINPDQESWDRSLFLGLIEHGFENDPKFLTYLTKVQLVVSLEFVRQLCHHELTKEWTNPKKRFEALYEFQTKLKNYISTLV